MNDRLFVIGYFVVNVSQDQTNFSVIYARILVSIIFFIFIHYITRLVVLQQTYRFFFFFFFFSSSSSSSIFAYTMELQNKS